MCHEILRFLNGVALYYLQATGVQSQINCIRVAASRMQIIPRGRQSHAKWINLTAATQVQFECNWWPLRCNLHARLAATRLQDKRQANKRCVKGRLYIIIIFFYHWQVHILDACFQLFSWRPLDIWFGKCAGSMDDIATRKQNSKQGSKFCTSLRPVANKAASFFQASCKNKYLN
jgi:hypothetical protein